MGWSVNIIYLPAHPRHSPVYENKRFVNWILVGNIVGLPEGEPVGACDSEGSSEGFIEGRTEVEGTAEATADGRFEG